MTENHNELSKMDHGIPFPDPFGVVEGLTNGEFYDPIRRRIRQKIHDILLSIAKNLQEG